MFRDEIMFIWNVGNHLQDDMVSQPLRPPSSVLDYSLYLCVTPFHAETNVWNTILFSQINAYLFDLLAMTKQEVSCVNMQLL
jgi:hypothetical protein